MVLGPGRGLTGACSHGNQDAGGLGPAQTRGGRPASADPRLHGVRRRLHSPGSLPGVALGRLSSPRAARSHLVEPPEETLVLLFGLSLKAACVKKSVCVVCSAPRVFADGPQPCNPGWEPKRDQRQGPRSLPSGHCPSPPSTTGPDGDFPGPGARSFCASSAPAVDRLWLLALSCVAVADPPPPHRRAEVTARPSR